jgi:hypothetical protein
MPSSNLTGTYSCRVPKTATTHHQGDMSERQLKSMSAGQVVPFLDASAKNHGVIEYSISGELFEVIPSMVE